MNELPLIDGMLLAAEVRSLGLSDRRYRDNVRSGQLVRLHRGAFAPKSAWEQWNPRLRYQMKCLGAISSGRTHPILSHESAAAMHGIPQLGAYPKLVHVLSTMAAGTRTEHGFRKHASPRPDVDVESRGELWLTSLARTAVELASAATFPNAVAALDWVLAPKEKDGPPRAGREELLECAERVGLGRGRARFLRALEFANPLSESPGESLSRVMIHQLGFPAPELQKEFFDADGVIGRVDFWWPDHNLFGEFDGIAKYIREEYARGLTPAEVVVKEKIREDRIRATGPSCTRWLWDDAYNPQRLFNQLLRAALPTWRRSAYRHSVPQ